MSLNDELDENAADLRSLQPGSQSPQINVPVVVSGTSERSVSKPEIILAIGILLGIIAIVWIFLQKNPSPQSSPSGNFQTAPPAQLKDGTSIPAL